MSILGPKSRTTYHRYRCCGGFTVIELLITMAVIMTIAAIAIPRLEAAKESAKNARAIADIHTLGGQAVVYQITHDGVPPDTLDEIGYGDLRDPWGSPYQYLSFSDVKGKGKMRKDRFLVPINSNFDLYSMGPDGESVSPLTAKASHDDIIWANDGAFIGKAADF